MSLPTFHTHLGGCEITGVGALPNCRARVQGGKAAGNGRHGPSAQAVRYTQTAVECRQETNTSGQVPRAPHMLLGVTAAGTQNPHDNC